MSKNVFMCACGCGGSITVRKEHASSGVPSFILGHHSRVMNYRAGPTREDWAAANQDKHHCECGCGAAIRVKPYHRSRGVPRFVAGHGNRGPNGPAYKGVDRWIAKNQGKHHCACGCGGVIFVQYFHHWKGIPKIIKGHHPKGSASPLYKKDRTRVRRRGEFFTQPVRRLIRARCRGRCASCGSASQLEYDHIRPIAEGGTRAACNGQLLCRRCHAAKTKAEKKRAAQRRRLDAADVALLRAARGIRRYVTRIEELQCC